MTVVEVAGAEQQVFCIDHAPPEVRDAMPRTPDDEVALLQQKLASLDQAGFPPDVSARIRADVEQVIEAMRAGRRRLSDLYVTEF